MQELDASGHRLRTVQFTTYAGEQVRNLYSDSDALREDWITSERRLEIIRQLENCGVTLEYLMEFVQQTDVDPFDLLCHFAFNAPLHTRKERANRVLKEQREFFAHFAPQARQILESIVEQYAQYGPAELVLPKVLYMPQVAQKKTITDISKLFGGATQLRNAVIELQKLLYAA